MEPTESNLKISESGIESTETEIEAQPNLQIANHKVSVFSSSGWRRYRSVTTYKNVCVQTNGGVVSLFAETMQKDKDGNPVYIMIASFPAHAVMIERV